MEEDEELLSGNWGGHGQASDVSTQNMATSPPPANLETTTQVNTFFNSPFTPVPVLP